MGKKHYSKTDNKFRVRTGFFQEARVKNHENGNMDLLLPEIEEEELRNQLPNVSVITITNNRGSFAGLMIYNWINIKYPRDKLEWVILDDSIEDPLQDYIPMDDPNIHYVKLDHWMQVAEKRNKAVSLAKYDYIVHMDDDDYYFPDSVLAKIRLMLHYKVQGVHSMPIGVYDMMEKTSYIFNPKGMDTNNVAEATLAYHKDYWRKHPFASQDPKGMTEGRAFIGKRFNQWLKVHFLFNMISITHAKNITGHNRRFINENQKNAKTGKFEDVFPSDFKYILENIRKILAVEYVQPEI